MDKLTSPSRGKIDAAQQVKSCRVIVEDQNMSGCLAPYRDKLRHNREDFLLFSRCCIRQSGVSISHHLFLTVSRDNVSDFLLSRARGAHG
jgi:hypothetical protein